MGNKTGIVYGMPDTEYRDAEGISRSELWTIHNRTPSHLNSKRKTVSQALIVGRAVHCGILEPEKFFTSYGKLPEGHNGATRDGKMAISEIHEANKEPLKHDVWVMIEEMRDALYASREVNNLLTGCVTEVSAFYEDPDGTVLKVRPDAVKNTTIIDLKTTESAAYGPFAKSCASYGYHVQDAYYRDVYNFAGGEVTEFLFLAVEKEPPYAFCLYMLDDASVRTGRTIYTSALARYKECVRTETFHSYPSGVNSLSIPAWAMNDETVNLLMEN